MDTWRNLHNNCQTFGEWLVTAEVMIREWQSADLPLAEAKAKQKDLEKQVTMKHRYALDHNICFVISGFCCNVNDIFVVLCSTPEE
jgi:hypothetical protein